MTAGARGGAEARGEDKRLTYKLFAHAALNFLLSSLYVLDLLDFRS